MANVSRPNFQGEGEPIFSLLFFTLINESDSLVIKKQDACPTQAERSSNRKFEFDYTGPLNNPIQARIANK